MRRSKRQVKEDDNEKSPSSSHQTPVKSLTGNETPKRRGRSLRSASKTTPVATTVTPSSSVRRSARKKTEICPPSVARIQLEVSSSEETSPTTRSSRKRPASKPGKEADLEETPKSVKRKTLRRTKKEDSKVVESNASAEVNNKNEEPAKEISSNVVEGRKLEWKFNVYGIPKCPLPCREAQFDEIWKFLFENITERNSGCMYVSGVPGTGKTVIVQAVVDTLKKIKEEKKKKNFDFEHLYINGLTLPSPDKLWKRMFKGIGVVAKTQAKISSKEALKRLDSYFESNQRSPVVLVVDELDQILDKQQSILYQLLEWSSHAKNMFSFVAIFNTISLPEHGLAMRNNSRMGFKRAVFPPYSYEELQTIVHNMLSTFKTCQLGRDCVSLLSRKVAAISGDARRALEIARRTLEIAESGNHTGIQAVSHAFKEIFSSAKIETIKYTSFLEQMILKTICDEIRSTGVEEILIVKIVDGVIPKAVYEGVQYYKDDILKALLRLAVMRLVILEDNRPSLHKRLLLKVPVEDVNFALGCYSDVPLEN